MAPVEGADDKAEPNVAAQTLQSSDGSDGGTNGAKEDEEETKFVEWDPSGRFGRVRSRPPRPVFVFFFCVSCARRRRIQFSRARATRQLLLPRARHDPCRRAPHLTSR